MELTKQQIKTTKGIAIIFMLLLHLFCTKQYEELYTPIIIIGQVPLIYYFALFADCCVAIYCFCSGYGLYRSYERNIKSYKSNNYKRLFKLYINSWIILIIFVVILGSITGEFNVIGEGLKDFILTVALIDPAYNGAWWFLTTYILLVVISPILYRIVDKVNFKPILFLSLLFYFIAYVQRIKGVIIVENEILSWGIRQLALFGTSQFPFMVGGIFAKYNTYSWLYRKSNEIKNKNVIGIIIIVAMIILHGFIETLFIAVFTGIIFICVFNLMDKPKWVEKPLIFIATYSTNLWLIHMFVYITYLRNLVYAPKYAIIIFPWFIAISLSLSIVVQWIYKCILNCFFHSQSNKENKSIELN